MIIGIIAVLIVIICLVVLLIKITNFIFNNEEE